MHLSSSNTEMLSNIFKGLKSALASRAPARQGHRGASWGRRLWGGDAYRVLTLREYLEVPPNEFKGSRVALTSPAPARVESQRCILGTLGGSAARVLSLREYSEVPPNEFKGSTMTLASRVPARAGSRRCILIGVVLQRIGKSSGS